jgi:hypothetical protein
MSTLGNKKVELFDTGAGPSEPVAEENVQLASGTNFLLITLIAANMLCVFLVCSYALCISLDIEFDVYFPTSCWWNLFVIFLICTDLSTVFGVRYYFKSCFNQLMPYNLIGNSPIEPEPTLNFVVYLNNNISLKILSEIISLVVVFKNKF